MFSDTSYSGNSGFRAQKRLTISFNSYSFDLFSAIRYTGIDENQRTKLWDDGLHLTSEGYKVMGDAIAVQMFELLKTIHQPKNIGTTPD